MGMEFGIEGAKSSGIDHAYFVQLHSVAGSGVWRGGYAASVWMG